MKLPQLSPDLRHLTRRGSGLDDRRHKRGELGGRPARLLGKLGMDEIKSIERMIPVLDAAVHVHTATGAGVPLNGRIGVDHFELVGIPGDVELIARHDGDFREQRPRGLPAFGASTYVVIGALARDGHLDGIAGASAREYSAREIWCSGLHAIVHCWMN